MSSDERRRVAERLRTYAKTVSHSPEYLWMRLETAVNGWRYGAVVDESYAFDNDVLSRIADLIDPTCVYEPTETLARWDENDHEHETNEPDFDCATFACSRCGYEMLYGDEYGWFDTEPPYAPHFKFCPNCSARVLPLKLYDKVVTDDDE